MIETYTIHFGLYLKMCLLDAKTGMLVLPLYVCKLKGLSLICIYTA